MKVQNEAEQVLLALALPRLNDSGNMSSHSISLVLYPGYARRRASWSNSREIRRLTSQLAPRLLKRRRSSRLSPWAVPGPPSVSNALTLPGSIATHSKNQTQADGLALGQHAAQRRSGDVHALSLGQWRPPNSARWNQGAIPAAQLALEVEHAHGTANYPGSGRVARRAGRCSATKRPSSGQRARQPVGEHVLCLVRRRYQTQRMLTRRTQTCTRTAPVHSSRIGLHSCSLGKAHTHRSLCSSTRRPLRAQANRPRMSLVATVALSPS